jgi:hypothetical protein
MSLTVLPKVAVHAELHKLQLLHTSAAAAAAATRASSSVLGDLKK